MIKSNEREIEQEIGGHVSEVKKINMLGDKDAAANIVVKNLEAAKKFYEDTVGLMQVGAESQELIVFRSGNSTINVYQSQYAGTNQGHGGDVGGR
jgi:hypothetical protein